MKRILMLGALILAGCATQPDKIATAYVSPLQYKDYDCDQLAMESGRISRRATELYTRLKKTADDDGAQMGIGLIIFWPTLFFLEGGDGPEAAEYARLRGERDAIEEVAVRKKCAIDFQPIVPPQPAKTASTENLQN